MSEQDSRWLRSTIAVYAPLRLPGEGGHLRLNVGVIRVEVLFERVIPGFVRRAQQGLPENANPLDEDVVAAVARMADSDGMVWEARRLLRASTLLDLVRTSRGSCFGEGCEPLLAGVHTVYGRSRLPAIGDGDTPLLFSGKSTAELGLYRHPLGQSDDLCISVSEPATEFAGRLPSRSMTRWAARVVLFPGQLENEMPRGVESVPLLFRVVSSGANRQVLVDARS